MNPLRKCGPNILIVRTARARIRRDGYDHGWHTVWLTCIKSVNWYGRTQYKPPNECKIAEYAGAAVAVAASSINVCFFLVVRFRLLWNSSFFFLRLFPSTAVRVTAAIDEPISEIDYSISPVHLNHFDRFTRSLLAFIRCFWFVFVRFRRAVEESVDWWSLNGLLLSCHCHRYDD